MGFLDMSHQPEIQSFRPVEPTREATGPIMPRLLVKQAQLGEQLVHSPRVKGIHNHSADKSKGKLSLKRHCLQINKISASITCV